ncbi:MAG TPA: hypothetical protein QF873_00030, partial [Patescibacteria group bacterium]|nr:hypothetical protein [Patescibacteria group bacterium]
MSTIGAGSDDLGGLRLVDIEEPVKPQTRSKPLTWSPPDPPECELAWQEWVKMRKQDRELEPRSPTDQLET